MKANAQPEWKGGDAYIIGGGASLRDFNLDFLKGKNTIGANDAFRLGPDRCARVLFVDLKWWKTTLHDLRQYAADGGIVYSAAPQLESASHSLPWLHQFERDAHRSVSTHPGTLGWSRSTGSVAVNLAALLGASRVFLLGFDMCVNQKWKATHWHNHRGGLTPPDSFNRFIKGFESLKAGMQSLFPNVQIFNVTDGTSALTMFPTMPPQEVFAVKQEVSA